ncbi:MAG: peptide chain release factor 1, partial [Candidatus Omnitrophica bacterium]|nr:peptide chain release factor 1 [Candidatus Omnitrophota bacterium]
LKLSNPDIFSDRPQYVMLSKRFAFLEKILTLIDQRDKYLKDKSQSIELLKNPHEDEELKVMARQEIETLTQALEQIEEDIENKVFSASEPDRDVIIEMRAAAGGEESALFAGTLFEMYSKFAEAKGWKIEVLNSHSTEIGGFKELIFSVKGDGVFTQLRYESGVHRVQRVPATESGGRIHTSTVTVAVLMEPDEVDLKINPDDLKIDTYRSSGAGGQHVNTTDSAVRITHIPTNTVVACQDERSQIKNREKAMRVLKARILEKVQTEENTKVVELRRVQIGTGERSEKIRTYNYPERRVTDHRINLTLYRLEEIIGGDLDEIIKALIKADREKQYESQGLV